jgi:hypothetical protein
LIIELRAEWDDGMGLLREKKAKLNQTRLGQTPDQQVDPWQPHKAVSDLERS